MLCASKSPWQEFVYSDQGSLPTHRYTCGPASLAVVEGHHAVCLPKADHDRNISPILRKPYVCFTKEAVVAAMLKALGIVLKEEFTIVRTNDKEPIIYKEQSKGETDRTETSWSKQRLASEP